MEFTTIASGFGLLEAPRVDEQDRLYSATSHGGVYRLNPGGKVIPSCPSAKGAGRHDVQMRAAHRHDRPRLILFDEKTGNSVASYEWEGKSCSFNDLHHNDNGSVYTGQINFDPLSNNKADLPAVSFASIRPGKVTKLWDGIEVTNGMG